MGLNPVDWIEDGIDYIEDTVSDFIDDPLGTIGQVAGESIRGMLGFATLGATNKYDVGYWIEKFKPEVNQVFQDRNVTIRNSLATREIVYGRVRKGGTLVYAGTSGADDRFINLVIVLASHACESINDVFFDDTLVATKLGTDVQDTQTFSIATDYQGKLAIFSQLGNHTEQYSVITAATPDDWTADHKLLGCTLLYVQMRYDKNLYRKGIPNITVVMDGKNDIYDPRGGGSTGYTNNHALVCLDYIRTKDGLRVPDTEIVMQTFIEGAEHCDDQVEGLPGIYLESRYTANGVIKIENRPLDNLEEMQKAAAAFITTSQGLWRYIRSEYIAPTVSFDESDIISDIQFSPSGSKEGRFNTVTGVFIAPSASWKASDYPAVTYPGYVAADGEELSTTIDFNFVTSPYQAQRLAKIAIERSRYGMTLTGTFKLKAVELQAGDRVSLSISSLGISNATFLVLDTGISFDGGVALVLRQDAAEIYTDSASDRTEFTPATLLNLPDPNPIVPTGVAISEELYSTNGGRNIKARAVVSWIEPEGRTQNYDVQFKPSADSNWRNVETSVFGTEARKDDLAVDTYDFRVRAINQLGWESDWSATVQHAFLGKTAPPPDIDSISAEDELVSWDYSSAPLDLDGFEVRIHLGINSDWTTASPMHDGLVSDSKFDVRDALIATSTILVKAKDTSGIYSVNAVSIAVSPSASGDNVNWSDVIDDDGNRPADGADVTDYDDDRISNDALTQVIADAAAAGATAQQIQDIQDAAAAGATAAQIQAIADAATTANWNGVGGAGKPADNATDGATWEDNINGQPDRQNLLNNLVDVSDWESGGALPSGLSHTSSYGYTNANSLVVAEGPTGFDEVCWQVAPVNAASDAGGFSFSNRVLGKSTKVYRVSVWFKCSALTGSFRFRSGASYQLSDGVIDYNPYVHEAPAPEIDKWFLAVMVAHPHNTSRITASGLSGVYDPDTGDIVSSFDEFKTADSSGSLIALNAAFQWVDSNNGTDVALFARPRLEVIDGTESRISSLIGVPEKAYVEAATAPIIFGVSSAGTKITSNGSNITTSKTGTGDYRLNHTGGYNGYPVIITPRSGNVDRIDVSESAGYVRVRFYDTTNAAIDSAFSAMVDYRYNA
jgi:hypothetical protein